MSDVDCGLSLVHCQYGFCSCRSLAARGVPPNRIWALRKRRLREADRFRAIEAACASDGENHVSENRTRISSQLQLVVSPVDASMGGHKISAFDCLSDVTEIQQYRLRCCCQTSVFSAKPMQHGDLKVDRYAASANLTNLVPTSIS